MIDGYTFYKDFKSNRGGKVRWRCSSAYRKCRGFVVMSEDDRTILKLGLLHDHDPPSYLKLNDGTYAKTYR